MKNQEIKVKANQSERTFTIRKYENCKLIAKYRTIKYYSREEFESMENNTENDWRHFLQQTNEYYPV